MSDNMARRSLWCCGKHYRNVVDPNLCCVTTGYSRSVSAVLEIKAPRACDDNTGCCSSVKPSCCLPRLKPTGAISSSVPQAPSAILSKPSAANNLPRPVCCNQPTSCCDYIPPPLEQSSDELDGPVGTLTFSVEGMTCSSCESTMKDALLDIKGVDLANVSVILGRAVTEGSAKVEDIIRQATRRTGFKITLVEDKPTLFLKFEEAPSVFPPKVPVLSYGKTIQFTYDPKQIGARDIFDFYVDRGFSLNIVDKAVVTPIWSILGYRVIISIILTIPVIVLTYIPPRPIIYGAIQMTLVTGIMVYVISPLYKQAIVTLLRRHEIEMDLLVVVSTSIAYGFSVIAYIFAVSGRCFAEPFWETPALLVTLIILGRWITTRAREKAVEAVKNLADTKVKTATLANGRIIDIALVGYDDIITIDIGSVIPTDGVIVQGDTEVSESMFTGESTPKVKLCKSNVFAGSVNLTSRIDVRVTRLSSENTLSGIRQLIDVSQVNKPRIQEYTDRVAGYFGPIALAAAVIAFIIWFLVNWRLRGQDISSAAIQGLTYAIAVLAITCPCTIGLAVPMNVVIASGIAARKGILIKDTHALEVMHQAKTVVFDKTGTLTKGEPEVVKEIIYHDGAQDHIRRLVANAAHPIAKAIFKHVGDAEPYENVEQIVGKGLQVKIGEGMLRGGSFTWLDIESPFGSSHVSTFGVTLNDQLLAVYGLTDQLRRESLKLVNDLKARNIDVYLVSGDNPSVVHDMAHKLNIPSTNVQSNAMPAVKSEIVSFLQSRSGFPVIFCGDGMNDAPALSQADVGISFISAAEITSTSASVLLLSNELGSIITLLTLSQRVYRRIKICFVWAGIYNVFAISLAAGALVVWRIDPRWAGLGELVSVLPVVIVGWSLKWNKYRST